MTSAIWIAIGRKKMVYVAIVVKHAAAAVFDAFFQFGRESKISLGDRGIHLYSGPCTCIKPSSLLVSFPYCPLIEQFLSEFPRCSTLGFECSPDACPHLFFQKEFS
jgi:hypothetical protein